MSSRSLRIFEIYDSIQGESTLAGTPCTFIRLAGCPLRCSYCDTEQALSPDSGQVMAIDVIVSDVKARARPLVLVTGGEPLAQKGCAELLGELFKLGVRVQLETAGAHAIADLPEGVSRIVDVKTPGSGESERNRLENLTVLTGNDELKFVITSHEDYLWARRFVRDYLTQTSATILFSPAWGMVDPADLCSWILEDQLPVRMQLQLHKVIWGMEASGV